MWAVIHNKVSWLMELKVMVTVTLNKLCSQSETSIFWWLFAAFRLPRKSELGMKTRINRLMPTCPQMGEFPSVINSFSLQLPRGRCSGQPSWILRSGLVRLSRLSESETRLRRSSWNFWLGTEKSRLPVSNETLHNSILPSPGLCVFVALCGDSQGCLTCCCWVYLQVSFISAVCSSHWGLAFCYVGKR